MICVISSLPTVSHSHLGSSHYVDCHTYSDHIENETNHWNVQMDSLMGVYLDYHYCDSGDGMPCNEMPPSPSDHDGQHVSLSEIELIDILSTYCPCYLSSLMYLYRA